MQAIVRQEAAPRIPKVLHYVFGMSRNFGGKPWSLMHHVCLKSAVDRIKPERVLFHYTHEPSGPWWRLSRPYLTLNKIAAPQDVFGNRLNHVAHKADVVRLRSLLAHGGIYLDADVFVQRSFDDLLDNSTVLGQEDAGDGIGLANAIILAVPNAPFLTRWYEHYQSFNGERWNEHSVKLPARLMADHPEEITVLPPRAFFWPTYQPQDIDRLFRSSAPIPLDGVYANHLWESKCWTLVKDLTPGDVRRGEGNFQRWAAPLLAGLPDDYGKPGLLLMAGQRVKSRLKALRNTVWRRG